MGLYIFQTLHHRNKTSVCGSGSVFLVACLLFSSVVSAAPSQNALLQQAREQFNHAQQLESALNDKPAEERNRSEYIRVINAYQRVYLITPRTGYADNALMTMARLYEEIKDQKAAIKTLGFLIREYPQTPFRSAAERDVARLQGVPEKKLNSASVDNIRFWEAANSVRVVVDLSTEVEFKQGQAKSPDRVFVDIAKSRLNSLLVSKPMAVGSSLLQQIRAAQFDQSTVRVVLDVGAVGKVTSYALKDPDRLIIDVFGVEKPATETAKAETVKSETIKSEPVKTETAKTESTKTAPAPLPAPVTSLPAVTESADVAPPPPVVPPAPAATATPPPAKPVTPPASKRATAKTTTKTAAKTAAKPVDDQPRIVPAKPTGAGDRSLLRSLGLKLQRVVIDAGHGGHDTGTIGPSGYTEKDLVLDVAKRLKELVEARLGTQTVLTREDDTFVPLEARTAMANQSEGDLFISIHANSSRVRTVRGIETYYLNITTSREALDVAMRENAASERSIHEQQSLIKNIMLRDKVEESRELARVIQKAMAARPNSGTDRGVKQAPFIGLIGASMPSILAEISFISNPQEEKLLKTEAYRQKIAESLFDGIRSYSESLSGLKTASKSQDKSQEH